MVIHPQMSRPITTAAALILFFLISPSWAQKRTANCFDSKTQLGLDMCADKQARKAQAKLESLLKEIRAANTHDESFLVALDKSQRAWEQYRSAQIELQFPKKDKQAEYGTVYPMCASLEWETLTEHRIAELRQWVAGVAEGDVCAGSVPVHSQ